MQILNTTIERGENKLLELPVGQLPSGTQIGIAAHVFRAQEEGPTMLVLGGVHGDEINGVEIVRSAIQNGLFANLKRGSVIAIPVLNVYGFINFSREVPDGKDVNRSFPGSKFGSLASRVAHCLHTNILPLIDFGVDLHTGGQSNYNYPQIRYTIDDQQAAELAHVFATSIILPYKPIARSLRKVARDKHDVPILVFEGGENLRYDKKSIDAGLDGIARLLAHHQMMDKTFGKKKTAVFNKSRWVRASKGGVFQWTQSSGDYVKKGQVIGFINDPHAVKATHYVKSPIDGFIFGHKNTPVVNQGDALFHIAYNV